MTDSADGFQPDGTYAVGQSMTVSVKRLDAQVVLQSPPSAAAVAGFSNPPFDYANESGLGVNRIDIIAFESNGDLVAAGGTLHGQRKELHRRSDRCRSAHRHRQPGHTFGAGGVTMIAFSGGPSVLAIQANGDILIASGSAIFRALG